MSAYEQVKTINYLGKTVREFDDLKGRSLYKVEKIEDRELIFYLTDSNYVRMYHEQDCSECVYIEDICGDLDDLVGSPLMEAEAVSDYSAGPLSEEEESYTWTFYKFSTRKGSVTVRWYGSSNGWYSESISIEVVAEISE